MTRVDWDNLGIPPLAGVCTYEEACAVGYDIERNVELLKRYNYIKVRTNELYAAHMAATPEWEVKCAMNLHMWLDAEHSNMLRKRVSEMREPPLGLDKVPDERLKTFHDELIRSATTIELLVGLYRVIKPKFIQAVKLHLRHTNPLVDHPTVRMLKWIVQEEEDMTAWGEQACQALIRSAEDVRQAELWETHLGRFLAAAGGVAGDELISATATAADDEEVPAAATTVGDGHPDGNGALQPRSDGSRYEMEVTPKRDSRFIDPFNFTGNIDVRYADPNASHEERCFALLAKRVREMDVPEYLAPVMYKTTGKPWEYYSDLSRQMWDEARHAMMGEVGYYQLGIPFYKYPIDQMTVYTLNREYSTLDAHTILYGIEQSLMNKDRGKRLEWLIAKEAGHRLLTTFQDNDWADEVLHAQIGRKWLQSEFGSLERLQQHFDAVFAHWREYKTKLAPVLSEQKEWFASALEEVKANWSKTRSAS